MSNRRPWRRLAAVVVILAAWLALLHFGLSVGSVATPPLGAFLSPYTGFYQNNEVDYWASDTRLPGLRAPVRVYYDGRLVPHVFASTEADLYYVQGYVQAQHRLFQLDLTARSAEGRLSEVLGARTLEFDRTRRRIGGHLLADQIDSLWRLDPATYAIVERYAEGVNAYLAQLDPEDYPVEYKLIDFAPEPWSPRRTALVSIEMAYTLNFANRDLANTKTRDLLGAETFDFLFPERARDDEPVIPPGTPFRSGDSALIEASRRLSDRRVGGASAIPPGLSAVEHPRTREGIGSNNWVVGPGRTETGDPLLANDPHLALSLPSIWFESELHAGGMSVHGVNLPGVPGVTIGFTPDAAWGVTNVGIDVLDWYALDYTDASRTAYRDGAGAVRPMTYRVERIGVRGGTPVADTTWVSEYGPIVYTDPGDARSGLAMSWLTAQRPSAETIKAFLQLNRARNVRDFLAASRRYEWPAQNMVFASTAGDIALRVSGTLPRNLPGEGRFVEASGGEVAGGYLAPSENPVAVNPPQGYLASANQVSTDETFPYYYGGIFDHSRSRRLNALLRADSNVSVADAQAMQLDAVSTTSRELLAVLLDLVDAAELSVEQRGLVETLRRWDGRYAATSTEAVLFEVWAEAFAEAVWDELAGESASQAYRTPARWRLAELAAGDPLNPFFDLGSTPRRETAGDLAMAALDDVLGRREALETDGKDTWAAYNEVRVMHLAKVPAFSRRNLSADGRASALNAQRGDVGPSWRMVVSLGAEPRATVVYPGGQSGRPGHPHYDDMLDAWVAGDYYDVRLRSDESALARDPAFTLVTFSP